MKDSMIHAAAAALMVSVYMMIPPFALPVIAVAAHWYCWELAQRIAKDGDHNGFFYWWDMARWGDTAKKRSACSCNFCRYLLGYFIFDLKARQTSSFRSR